MKRIFTKLSVLVLLLLGICLGQTSDSYWRFVNQGGAALVTGATPWYKTNTTSASTSSINWTTLGTLASCTVQVDFSNDGSTVAGQLIAAQTCTGSGTFTATSTATPVWVRASYVLGSGGGGINFVVKGCINSACYPATPSGQGSSYTLAVTGANFTCGTGGTVDPCTTATPITGLTQVLPSAIANYSFDCILTYSQATANTSNQFGLQTFGNGVTQFGFTTVIFTALSTSTTNSQGPFASTTTAQMVTFLPTAAVGSKLSMNVKGTLEGTSASGTTFRVMISTGLAADVLTIYRDVSFCHLYANPN